MMPAVGAGVIHIRGEGWKELKVGRIGKIQLGPTKDPVTGEMLDLAHTIENTYMKTVTTSSVSTQPSDPAISTSLPLR